MDLFAAFDDQGGAPPVPEPLDDDDEEEEEEEEQEEEERKQEKQKQRKKRARGAEDEARGEAVVGEEAEGAGAAGGREGRGEKRGGRKEGSGEEKGGDEAEATAEGDASPRKKAPRLPPAKEYAFTLDTFQREAIDHIENGDSVLVAAHTSAGKTVCAEYAIATALRARQRVIYTSPIKALSNQKFRDFHAEFTDVGLMTGDITINPSATCLVMTTEILRSMLYRGSEIMREVKWVIYDEVHYMRDKERGVVWEESIILLPHTVRFVFLSATIPNAQEFAGWITKVHDQPCHVVYTDYRPVPLQHYIFPAGGDGLFLVVDEKGRFRDDNFQRAMTSLQGPDEALADGGDSGGRNGGGGGGGGGRSGGGGRGGGGRGGGGRGRGGGRGIGGFASRVANTGGELARIVKLIMTRGLDPCIIFSFSKRECEAYAKRMSRQDFNDDDEKALIEQVFTRAIEVLSDEDKQLPQVQDILPLLKRGIGIHHGGLLPILKEVIEILFSEGLIKCLFATETFSIGINMPARTVVFTKCRKYDGTDFRWITSGEYIQMSGRAGRRGIDDKGVVIQMLDEKMEPDVAKGILYGEPDRLYSSYHVSYNMLLNMLRVEGADPEFLVRSSFHQYQQEQQLPALEAQAQEYTDQAAAIELDDEEVVREYFNVLRQIESTQEEVYAIMRLPEHSLPFLQSGRLARFRNGLEGGDLEDDEDDTSARCWGVVVELRRAGGQLGRDNRNAVAKLDADQYTVHALVACVDDPKSNIKDRDDKPVTLCHVSFDAAEMRVVGVPLSHLDVISALRVDIPRDVRSDKTRKLVRTTLHGVHRRYPDGPTLLEASKDMHIDSETLRELERRMGMLETHRKELPFHSREDRDALLAQCRRKTELEAKAALLREEAQKKLSVSLCDTLKRMKRVLRRLGYTNAENVIDVKGRIACEINTADELVVTELMFDGVFNELSPPQVVGLLSTFVFQESKSDEPPAVRDDLQAPFRQLQEAARHVANASLDAKMEVDPTEYVEQFRTQLVDICFHWASGVSFRELLERADEGIYEGSIIRAIRRLDELLRQLSSAAFAIGNHDLKEKFEEASQKIRRDIVFTASLFIS